jgi:hypothetical protein
MTPEQDDTPWLVRPRTIRRLWAAFIAVLAATVLAGAVVHGHATFGIEGTFGFFAWFGFATCVVMVVGAKILGIFLKREDTYYDD